MVGTDYIDLKALTLDELSGVVHLYPWYGAARKELCARMARTGGSSWGTAQFAEEALYVGNRKKIADMARTGARADYSDKDLQALLKSYIAPEPEESGTDEGQREVHVVGGDYFSQSQYNNVRRSEDNIFTRFAVKARPDGTRDEKAGADIAERFATQTLAEIFAEQGCVDEARRIYSRLILDNPEKSAYFASLIDKLK